MRFLVRTRTRQQAEGGTGTNCRPSCRDPLERRLLSPSALPSGEVEPQPTPVAFIPRPFARPCGLRRRAEAAHRPRSAPRRSPARSETSAAAAGRTLPGNRPLPRCHQSEPEQA